jgi:hypothetical protein
MRISFLFFEKRRATRAVPEEMRSGMEKIERMAKNL